MSTKLTFTATVDAVVDDDWKVETINGVTYLVRGDDSNNRDEVRFEPEDVLASLSPDVATPGVCTIYDNPPWSVRVMVVSERVA